MALSLITDRTALDVNNHTAKGYYTYSDLNRVGAAINYIAALLNSYGYYVAVSPKADWTANGIPSTTQMAVLLNDLGTIKSKFYGATTLPSSMSRIGFEDANNIERLLLEIERYINLMMQAFRYCGAASCGMEAIF